MDGIRTCQMPIDGDWVDASNGATFDSVSPITGKIWARISEETEPDVDRAVRAADRAFTCGAWAEFTPSQRGKCLRKLGDLLAERSEDLDRAETTDTGKMLKETRWQAKYISEFFHFYAGAADKIAGETLPIHKPDLFVFTNREPLGVVAAVVPWNSQLFLVAVKIGPALAAGNTVVLKASGHASVAMLDFGKLVAEAGFPPGVVNIITGHGDSRGRVLTSHPLVVRISFTGGPGAARQILRNSAENFAEVPLELGGKSPFIVFADAYLESAVNGSVAGIFGVTGQSCVSGSRLLLQEDIAEEFLKRMVALARSIRIGEPLEEETQMDPLCTEGQLTRIQRQVALAERQGGRVLTGERQLEGLAGNCFEPTIIDCHRPALDIVGTELFGPGPSVLPFRTEHEAIALANGSQHGLAAGIFSRDGAPAAHSPRSAGRHRLGQHLLCGLADRRLRRGQGIGLRARKRLSGDIRLHAAQDCLDHHSIGADGHNPFVMR